MGGEQEASKWVERCMSFCQCGCGQEIIFSIATYLNRGSQARVITDPGRGVA